MDYYRVEFAKRAEKELRRLDKRYIPRIIAAAEKLAIDPRPAGSKKLVGADHTYRIRVGDYRVIYELEDNKLIVSVIRIRHRQSAYE